MRANCPARRPEPAAGDLACGCDPPPAGDSVPDCDPTLRSVPGSSAGDRARGWLSEPAAGGRACGWRATRGRRPSLRLAARLRLAIRLCGRRPGSPVGARACGRDPAPRSATLPAVGDPASTGDPGGRGPAAATGPAGEHARPATGDRIPAGSLRGSRPWLALLGLRPVAAGRRGWLGSQPPVVPPTVPRSVPARRPRVGPTTGPASPRGPLPTGPGLPPTTAGAPP
jgi:hypothetical protein